MKLQEHYLEESTTASFPFLASYHSLYSRKANHIPRKSLIITICGVNRSVSAVFIYVRIKLTKEAADARV